MITLLIQINIPQIGQDIMLGELLTIGEIINTTKSPTLTYRDAKEDMDYELLAIDYEHFVMRNITDDWLLGYADGIPGAKLRSGFEEKRLRSLFKPMTFARKRKRRMKEFNFPEFSFEDVVFVLYEMDAAAYGSMESVKRRGRMRCCPPAGNFFKIARVEPATDMKTRKTTSSPQQCPDTECMIVLRIIFNNKIFYFSW